MRRRIDYEILGRVHCIHVYSGKWIDMGKFTRTWMFIEDNELKDYTKEFSEICAFMAGQLI